MKEEDVERATLVKMKKRNLFNKIIRERCILLFLRLCFLSRCHFHFHLNDDERIQVLFCCSMDDEKEEEENEKFIMYYLIPSDQFVRRCLL